MSSGRILVVDDGADMRDFVVEYVLKPNGYQWLVAEDGQRGLQLALSEAPDLVLLDLQMPRMDGTNMLREMQERGLNIPVVLMTFHGSEEIAVEVFRMGVVNYIIKPFNVDEMLEAIERALAASRLRDERDDLTERLVASNLDLKRRVRELQALYVIGKSIAARVEPDTLLARVADAAAYVTSADACAIHLLDETSGDFVRRVAKAGTGPSQITVELTSDEAALNLFHAHDPQPVLIDGDDAGMPGHNYLYVPVILEGKTLGVLSVISQVALAEHQIQLLDALADQLATGLSVAR